MTNQLANQQTIMAIGGHVGDAELTCGGVLATASLQGWRIVTVALTAGERGNPPHLSVAEYRIQKIKEAEVFASRLGGQAYVFDYVDGELPDNEEVRFKLCDLIRKEKPKVLLTHWKNSIHKDHIVAHNITKDAQFYAGLPSIARELPAHYAGGPYYAQNWEDSDGFHPYVYAEVSEEGFALWKEAIQSHWFAIHSPSFRYAEYYEYLMKCNGCLARKSYAEAFAIDETQIKRVIPHF